MDPSASDPPAPSTPTSSSSPASSSKLVSSKTLSAPGDGSPIQPRSPSGSNKPRPVSAHVSSPEGTLSPPSPNNMTASSGATAATPPRAGRKRMFSFGGSKASSAKEKDKNLSVNQRLVMAQTITTVQLSAEATLVIKPLTEPVLITKISTGGKVLKRKFFIDLERLQVSWISGKKASDRSCVNVRDIVELRLGHKSERLLKKKDLAPETMCFTIVYGGSFETLDLICNTPEERDSWVTGIRLLIEKTGGDNMFSFLKQMWTRVDVNGDGKLDFAEVQELLKTLNINIDRKRAKRDFDAVDLDKNGTLDFDEFAQFYQSLRYRAEINELYRQTLKDSPSLSAEAMREFLISTQEEEFSTDDEFIASISPYVNDRGEVPLEGFARYMDSAANSAFKTTCNKIYQDMTRPLPHYFIYSSHNTYLLGDQLRGKSSVEAYIRALQSGCRCVELDCWDGPNNEPIIFHGHTLTSKILFRDVIAAIRDYAFSTSEYPVILSLENHCSNGQQDVMAAIMRELFGDLLLKEPFENNAGLLQLPSPEQLKRKIILKGKGLAHNSLGREMNLTEFFDVDEDSDGDIAEMSEESNPKDFKEINEKLAGMVVYCKTTPFKNFQHSKTNHAANEMSSFSEKSSEKHCTKSGGDFISHNRRQLSRIYPAGSRVDSSNYNPMIHWIYGNQIVALNFQTFDVGMELNFGRFLDNGRCGYVLKPRYLREEGVPAPRAKILKIKFISAQQLPKPDQSLKGEIIDPYVELEIFGADNTYKKVKTKTVQDNGFNPVWNESFEFVIMDPELTMLRFVVMDEDLKDDDFIASNAFPLSCLAVGYRHIPLYDSKHSIIPFSSVFVKVELLGGKR